MEITAGQLIAYTLEPPHLPIEPAAVRRSRMGETSDRYANRCLPMLIANQLGQHLLNRGTTSVTGWEKDYFLGGAQAAISRARTTTRTESSCARSLRLSQTTASEETAHAVRRDIIH
jgi:hypothetical protein